MKDLDTFLTIRYVTLAASVPPLAFLSCSQTRMSSLKQKLYIEQLTLK